jgi:DNA-binding transcriptional regulator YiaG
MPITAAEVYSIRTQAGLSQVEAAELIKAGRRTWESWESGRRNMPVAKYNLFVILMNQQKEKQDHATV